MFRHPRTAGWPVDRPRSVSPVMIAARRHHRQRRRRAPVGGERGGTGLGGRRRGRCMRSSTRSGSIPARRRRPRALREPPVRAGYNGAPTIEDADFAWAEWVKRWHATSTLTSKVRAIIRTIMAKAGPLACRRARRDHRARPLDPPNLRVLGRGSRPHVRRRLRAAARRSGRPGGLADLAPHQAALLVASRTFSRDCQEWEWHPSRWDPSRALAVPRAIAVLIETDLD